MAANPVRDAGRDHFVYMALDSSGDALYVGLSSAPERRIASHRSALWWPQVARWRMSGPYLRSVAYELERELIEDLDPIGNVMHTSRYVHPRRKDAA